MYKNMKEFGKAWVKALRSGEYKQTTGALLRVGDRDGDKNYDTFCCLGVAFDLLALESPRTYYWDNDSACHKKEAFADGNLTSARPPKWLYKWLTADVPNSDDRETRLIELNDSGKKGFKAIATYIEKNI
jgi:hypothetical protein